MNVLNNIIAINIVTNDHVLLNKKSVPILFDLNLSDNFLEYLQNDKLFNEYIHDLCFSIEHYSNTVISCCKFIYNEEHEKSEYVENVWNVQDLFEIKANDMICFEYLFEIFKKLFVDFMKFEYDEQIMFSLQEEILDIYLKIQEKFPKRMVKESVLHYCRKQLSEKYKLSHTNIDTCINTLEDILKDVK